MPGLQRGQIVWAWIDGRGRGERKRRPCVVLSPTDDISNGKPIAVICGSGSPNLPLRREDIVLPYREPPSPPHPVTKLYKMTVAVCDWPEIITQADIASVGGVLPTRTMVEIMRVLREINPKDDANR